MWYLVKKPAGIFRYMGCAFVCSGELTARKGLENDLGALRHIGCALVCSGKLIARKGLENDLNWHRG